MTFSRKSGHICIEHVWNQSSWKFQQDNIAQGFSKTSASQSFSFTKFKIQFTFADTHLTVFSWGRSSVCDYNCIFFIKENPNFTLFKAKYEDGAKRMGGIFLIFLKNLVHFILLANRSIALLNISIIVIVWINSYFNVWY